MNCCIGMRVRAYGVVEADAPEIANFYTFLTNGEKPVMMGD